MKYNFPLPIFHGGNADPHGACGAAGAIRGHKGQNSTGTRCRGFLVMEPPCRVFLSWNLDVVAFLSSEKMPLNYDVVG